MRIACISASTIPSRTANSMQVMKVCQAYVDLGHEVELWLPGSNPKINPGELASNYGLRTLFPMHWLITIPTLRKYDFAWRALNHARAWKPDVIQVWPLQAAALSSRLGLPTILEMHDPPSGRFGPRLFRAFLEGKGARKLLPVTRALRDWLAEQYAVTLDDAFAPISPNGVDLSRYQELPEPEQARQQLGIPFRFTVGYCGHLYPGRGIDLLFELARRNPQMQFLWAGGEEEALSLWEKRIEKERVSNLSLLGFMSNERLPLIQAACDVLLMPYEDQVYTSSGSETSRFASPMKAFEYLASGRAILSSDLPVLREVLNEGNAILLPPNDGNAWNRVLRELSEMPEVCRDMGRKAKQDSEAYTWVARAERALHGLGDVQNDG